MMLGMSACIITVQHNRTNYYASSSLLSSRKQYKIKTYFKTLLWHSHDTVHTKHKKVTNLPTEV